MPAVIQTRKGVEKHIDDTHRPATQNGGMGPPEFSHRIESFLLRQTPSCFTAGPGFTLDFLSRHLPVSQQGPDFHWTSCARQLPASQQAPYLHWTFLDLPEHWCYYLSFSLLFQRAFFPGQGILDEPPNVLPIVRVPGRERRLLETMQLAIGEFITDSSQGLPPSPRV